MLFNKTAWLVTPNDFAQELGIPGNCRASGIGAATICGEPAGRGIDYLEIYVTGIGESSRNSDSCQPMLGTGQAAPLSGNPLYWTCAAHRDGRQRAGPDAVLRRRARFLRPVPDQHKVTVAAPTGDGVQLVIATPNGATENATTVAVR